MNDLGPLHGRHKGGRVRQRPAAARGFRVAAALVTGLALAAGAALGPRAIGELERLARSRPFQVRRVAVVGAERLSPDAIVAAAGILAGTPLVDVDPRALAARVAALPGVRSARALRLPPDRIVVGVTERVARGVAAAGPGASPHLVSEEGVPFAAAQGREALGLPLLVAPGAHALGQADSGLAQAVKLARAARAAGFSVARVIVGADRTELRLDGLPARVRVGPAPYEPALGRLVQLVSRRPDLVVGATSIDVRFADRAVLQSDGAPKGAQQEAAARGSASLSTQPAAGKSAVGKDRGGERWHARTT